jgi:uncharacterized protein (TIGR02246 family)
MQRFLCILAASLMLSGALTMADEATPTGDAHPAIAALVAAEDAAWNGGDAARFAERVLPDVVFTNVIGMFSVGKAPFIAQHERIFSTIYKGSALHQAIENLTILSPDIAIVDTLCTLTGATHAPPGVEMIDGAIHTRLEQVLVRRADGWWVASFHNVAVNPAAAAIAAPSKP